MTAEGKIAHELKRMNEKLDKLISLFSPSIKKTTVKEEPYESYTIKIGSTGIYNKEETSEK